MRGVFMLVSLIGIALLVWAFGTQEHEQRGVSSETAASRSLRRDAQSTQALDAEASQLRGRLVEYKTGVPIEGVRVIVDNRVVVWSDARGEFDIPCASGAERAEFYILPTRHSSLWADVPLRRDRLVFELEPGLTVSGVVRTRSGDTMANVSVSAGTTETWTDAEGRFSLGGLSPGDVEIRCLSNRQQVEAGEKDVEVVLDGSYLHVDVCDDMGNPVREVSWENMVVGSQYKSWLARILVRHKPGESVDGVVRKDGFLPTRLRWSPRSAAPGLSRTTLVLRRRPDNALSIQVQRADGSPARVAYFTLTGDDGLLLLRETVALTKGRGRVEGVPAGRFTAHVHGGQDPALGVRVPVSIQPGDDNEAQFELPPGTIAYVLWSPYATRYSLELRPAGSPANSTELRHPFGQYPGRELWAPLSRLPYGRYRLVELRIDEVTRERMIDIRAGDVQTIDWSRGE